MRLSSQVRWLAGVLLVFGVLGAPGRGEACTQSFLTDRDFEPGTVLHAYARTAANPWMAGEWNAESANVIQGAAAGILPLNDDGMLRVNDAGGVVSQVSQIIDVTGTGMDVVNYSVSVNAPSATPIRLFLGAGDGQTPVGTLTNLTSELVEFTTDADPETWEEVTGSRTLPASTAFLHYELRARNDSIPVGGVFFDAGYVELVPDGPVGTIEGQITDYNGNPIAALPVTISGRQDTTDSAGRYAIGNLPHGAHTVRASGGGHTYGTSQYQDENYCVDLNGSTETVDITGFDRNPIIYIHGWNGSTHDLDPYPSELSDYGYADYYVDYWTTLWSTQKISILAEEVTPVVSKALAETGQRHVIIMAHSMGGLVARAYMESTATCAPNPPDDLACVMNPNKVAQYFSFGTPHKGTPLLAQLAGLLPGQAALLDMTTPGITLFNALYRKHPLIGYHAIGGDAPLWKTGTVCWELEILGWTKTICYTGPVSDYSFRNVKGFLTGVAISGPDDAFIHTVSSTGLHPNHGIDQFVTQEIHAHTALGSKDYFEWLTAPATISQQSYEDCVEPLLVTFTKTKCGTGSLRGTERSAPTGSLLEIPEEMLELAQRATPLLGVLEANETVSRTVVVEGGETIFTASLAQGSVSFHVVDPTGRVVDPAYVAGIIGDPDDPDAEFPAELPTEAVIYDGTSGDAFYFFPNAAPGMWTVVTAGQSDIPAEGTPFSSEVIFDSNYEVSLDLEALFLTPGTTTTFMLQAPSLSSATVTILVEFADGTSTPLTSTPQVDGYSASMLVPDKSGHARVQWSIVGTRQDGVTFERGGYEHFQITTSDLVWGSILGETALPRAANPAFYKSLVLDAQIDSTYDGTAQVAAEIVDAQGAVAARMHASIAVSVGSNVVPLVFDGDEIYDSGVDGSYFLSEVLLVDTRGVGILAAYVEDGYGTLPYHAYEFAPGGAVVPLGSPWTRAVLAAAMLLAGAASLLATVSRIRDRRGLQAGSIGEMLQE